MTLGICCSRWGARPFVVQLLPFPAGTLEDPVPKTEELPQVKEPRMHPFLLAQLWRERIEDDAKLNKTRIAVRESISRARVTQVMNLPCNCLLRFKPAS